MSICRICRKNYFTDCDTIQSTEIQQQRKRYTFINQLSDTEIILNLLLFSFKRFDKLDRSLSWTPLPSLAMTETYDLKI